MLVAEAIGGYSMLLFNASTLILIAIWSSHWNRPEYDSWV